MKLVKSLLSLAIAVSVLSLGLISTPAIAKTAPKGKKVVAAKVVTKKVAVKKSAKKAVKKTAVKKGAKKAAVKKGAKKAE
jgi:hypothetical protein